MATDSDKISHKEAHKVFCALYCSGVVGLRTIRPDVERRKGVLAKKNQRPLFHCHAVGKWWGQSVPCRERQSPVGLLILRQYVCVMFHHLSLWELQVGFFSGAEILTPRPPRCIVSLPEVLKVACTVFKMYLLWSTGIIKDHFTFSEAYYYVLYLNITFWFQNRFLDIANIFIFNSK